MNVAWQQIGDVLAANRLIRFAQLMGEALWQWHTRQLQPLLAAQPDKLMFLSAPVQKRILIQAAPAAAAAPGTSVARTTVAHQLRRASCHPWPCRRRCARFCGPLRGSTPSARSPLAIARWRRRGWSLASMRARSCRRPQAHAAGAQRGDGAGGSGAAVASAPVAGRSAAALSLAANSNALAARSFCCCSPRSAGFFGAPALWWLLGVAPRWRPAVRVSTDAADSRAARSSARSSRMARRRPRFSTMRRRVPDFRIASAAESFRRPSARSTARRPRASRPRWPRCTRSTSQRARPRSCRRSRCSISAA